MEILVTHKKDRVLKFFLDHPTKKVHLRELSRILDISFPWTRKLVGILAKEGFLVQRREHGLVLAEANREAELFLALKRCSNLFALYQSGFVAKLGEIYHRPEAIVLFGSYGRGDDTEQSDIDIAIFTQRSLKFDLQIYEKKLQRKIKLQELRKEKINKEFLTTLANGIVLSGYLEVS